MRLLLLLLTVLFFLSACRDDKRKGKLSSKNSSVVFADYRVSGDADKADVSVVLQFRRGDEDGDAEALPEPASVALDEEPLPADSANRSGAFYEAVKPAADFVGSHRIRYTDASGKTYEEGFRYQPFSLAQGLPEALPKQPFSIRLASFPNAPTTVQLVLTDTSFASIDVNEDVVVEKGEIKITAKHLAALAAGPINLEIYRDEEQPVKPAGRLVITYGLRRQFELK